ncbi:MAG TPA: hypothetical protein VK818_08795 [Methylomirabilota bacterium]|jgi:hypothetical protein|nr:hypothetical protein [Methylomirabilota bacterium]
MRTLCFQTPRAILIAALLLGGQSLTLALAGQKPGEKPKRIPKTIWNFDGGVFLETDGSLSDNTCFRLAGHMADKVFFDNLKRIDDNQGTRYLRGKEIVTEFPDHLKLLFVIHDQPCPSQVPDPKGRQYLTREMMSTMRLSLFWKRGVDLRPAENFKVKFFSVEPIPPYATELANDLPKRFQWAYELEIPSAGIPLSDSLVLIFRRDDGHIAARVAARL